VKTLATLLVMVLIVAANLAADYLIVTNPGQLRLRVQRELSNFITTRVSVERVKFDPPAGISIYGLRVFDTSGDSSKESVLTIPLMRVELDLYRQAIRKITADSPSLSVRVDKSGNLNLAKLLKEQPPARAGKKLEIPEIEIIKGFVSLDAALGESDFIRTELRSLNLSVKVKDGAVVLSGGAASPVLGNILFSAQGDAGLKSLAAHITASKVSLSDQLQRSLPRSVQSVWNELNIGGWASLEGNLCYDKNGLDYEATVRFSDCSAKLRSFPVPISGMSGAVKLKKDSILIENFKYLLNGVEGKTDGVIKGDLKSPKISIKSEVLGMPLNKTVREAFSERDRKTWDEYSPQGKADLLVNISKEKNATGAPKLYIEATGTGEASIEYQGFKYRLEHLRGSLIIADEGVFIRNITSTDGTQTVRIDGEIRHSRDVAVKIEGTSVRIDDKLLSALSEEERKLVDSFQLQGETDLLVRIASGAVLKRVGVTVEISPNCKTCARPRDFPVPIGKISGKIILQPDGEILLQQIRGKIGAGEVAVSDTAFQKSETSELNIKCSLKSLLIDDSLLQAVSSASKTDFSFLQISGLADAQLSLYRPGGGKDVSLFCGVTVRGASVMYKDFPLPATEINGYLEMTPQGLFIKSLRGKCHTGTALIWGEIETGKGKNSLRLNIEVHRIPLDNQVKAALPAGLKEIYDSFSPSGYATVAVRLTGIGGKIEPRITLTLENCSAKYTAFPYRVTGLSGRVKVNPAIGEVVIEEMTASDPPVRLRGVNRKTAQGQETTLEIKSDELSLSPELRDALPEGLCEVLKTLSLKGSLGVSLSLIISEKAGAKPHIQYTAKLMPRNCSFSAGLPFDEVSGEVTLEGEVLPSGEHKLNLGRLAFSDFTVAKRRIQSMSAGIILEGDKIRVYPITGKIAGGTLTGEISASISGKGDYSGNLSVTQASIRDAVEDILGKKIESASGYANARLDFSGEGTEESDFKATGAVKFKDANLVEVPVFSHITEQLSGVKTTFEVGNAQFTIKKSHFYFSELKFKSNIYNLDAVGKMRFDGKLNLTFSVEWIGKFLPIGVKQIWKFIQDNVFQLHLTGDLHRVIIEPQSFKPLGDAFKELLEEKEEEK
jgi:hypothetical protein